MNALQQTASVLADQLFWSSPEDKKVAIEFAAMVLETYLNDSKPIGSVHKDTLAMLPDANGFDCRVKLWPPKKAKYDEAYVSVYRVPTQADLNLTCVGEAGDMPGTSGGFTFSAFKSTAVPKGAKLYIKLGD